MIQGDIAAYFESGNTVRSVETITYNHLDPGGKSYGRFQLSVRSGTLKKYLAWSKYQQEFSKVNPGSKEFDKIWVKIAKDHTDDFDNDQYEFVSLTHFLPVQRYAKLQGFNTENFAINEALFSIGVQHGGFKNILNIAAQLRTCSKPSVKEDIDNLYKARNMYVDRIRLDKKIAQALHNRYDKECKMVQKVFTSLGDYQGQELQCQGNTVATALNFQEILQV